MSTEALSVSEAVQRLRRRDPILKWIVLIGKFLADSNLGELADCLLAHPDIVKHVYLGMNQLTDKTGVKLARYLAASSTIETFNVGYNQFGEATYLAVAEALRVNTSLRGLFLNNNQIVDQTSFDAAFIDALWLNPDRPAGSKWLLYSDASFDIDFKRLKAAAEQLGHPSLQVLLVRLC